MEVVHSEEVTVVRDGIQVRASTLAALGIHKMAYVWGAWVDNPLEKSRSTDAGMSFDDRRRYFLTPVPFDAWPSTFRLQIKASNLLGTIEQVASVIEAAGLNILMSECAPMGPGYANWQLIVEVPELGRLADRLGPTWSWTRSGRRSPSRSL